MFLRNTITVPAGNGAGLTDLVVLRELERVSERPDDRNPLNEYKKNFKDIVGTRVSGECDPMHARRPVDAMCCRLHSRAIPCHRS